MYTMYKLKAIGIMKMKNTSWEQADKLPEYVQLRLIPLTFEEVLAFRMKELEAKLERQRKAQFAKIGRNDKAFREILERLDILERGLCTGQLQTKNDCEIIDMPIAKNL